MKNGNDSWRTPNRGRRFHTSAASISQNRRTALKAHLTFYKSVTAYSPDVRKRQLLKVQLLGMLRLLLKVESCSNGNNLGSFQQISRLKVAQTVVTWVHFSRFQCWKLLKRWLLVGISAEFKVENCSNDVKLQSFQQISRLKVAQMISFLYLCSRIQPQKEIQVV